MTPEQALQTYAARRDAEAFRRLVEEYQGLVYSAASRLLKSREDIDDVTQQTFLKLAQRAGSIRENLAAWLHATAVNAARDRVRRDSTRRRHEDRLLVSKTDAPPAEWSELSAIIDEEIARLPPAARELIVAHFLHGESHRALADRLGVNQSTISRRMEQGVTKLRNSLKNRGFTDLGTVAAAFAALPRASVPARITAELAKVGLAGATTASALPLTFAFAAIIAIAAATLAGIWLLRPGNPATPLVTVPATAPAATSVPASPPIPPAYALAPDEELRRVRRPFPPERENLLRELGPRYGNVDRTIQNDCVFYLRNGSLMLGGSGGGPMNTEQFLRTALRIQWFHRDNFESIDWQPGDADWVIRGSLSYDENIEKRLQAWAKMLSADTGKQISFESYKTTRPCIVMKGRHRLPDYQDRNGMHPVVVAVQTLSPEEMMAIKKRFGRGSATRFEFEDVGQLLDAPFFGPYVGEIFYILPDAHLDHTQPTFKEDLQKVLTGLQSQVGCEWTIQDREIQVWRPVVK